MLGTYQEPGQGADCGLVGAFQERIYHVDCYRKADCHVRSFHDRGQAAQQNPFVDRGSCSSWFCIPKASFFVALSLGAVLKQRVHLEIVDRPHHIAMICVVEIGLWGWPCTCCGASVSSNIASSICSVVMRKRACCEVRDQDPARKARRVSV